MGGAEKWLVLADWLAFIVVDCAATADPARCGVDLYGMPILVEYERARTDVAAWQGYGRLSLWCFTMLGNLLRLYSPPKAVRVCEVHLDLVASRGLWAIDVCFSNQSSSERWLSSALEAVEIIHNAGRCLLEQPCSLSPRINDEST